MPTSNQYDEDALTVAPVRDEGDLAKIGGHAEAQAEQTSVDECPMYAHRSREHRHCAIVCMYAERLQTLGTTYQKHERNELACLTEPWEETCQVSGHSDISSIQDSLVMEPRKLTPTTSFSWAVTRTSKTSTGAGASGLERNWWSMPTSYMWIFSVHSIELAVVSHPIASIPSSEGICWSPGLGCV